MGYTRAEKKRDRKESDRKERIRQKNYRRRLARRHALIVEVKKFKLNRRWGKLLRRRQRAAVQRQRQVQKVVHGK